jgi:hypothetical protein
MRYCVFALTLVVGFAVGFLVPVVSDVFVNGLPVTPRDQVADQAKIIARAVAQITQPPTPPPETAKPPTPDPSITSKKPVPPASVPESAARSLSALQNAAEDANLITQWKHQWKQALQAAEDANRIAQWKQALQGGPNPDALAPFIHLVPNDDYRLRKNP